MDGLEDQLGGMGTAFASSLLGLAGSLVVGLLELFAGHGQNRFYREMEEWLASITRVSFSSGDGEGGVDRGAIATVLDHMVDQIESLQSLFAQSETRQAAVDQRMVELTHAVGGLTERLGFGQVEAVERLSASQDRLAQVLEERGSENGGMDQESRMRLRSIDVQLFKIFEEMGSARWVEIEALRGEMGQLSEALRALTRAAQPPAATRRPPDSGA
jgi:chromosome condensin MukBEF ATPase and DNA-binding subunit MukB